MGHDKSHSLSTYFAGRGGKKQVPYRPYATHKCEGIHTDLVYGELASIKFKAKFADRLSDRLPVERSGWMWPYANVRNGTNSLTTQIRPSGSKST